MTAPTEHPDTAQDGADPDTGELPDDGPGWVDGRIANLRGMEEAGRKVVEAEAQIALNEAAAEAELETLARKVRLVRERQEKADGPFRARAERYRGFMLGFMDQNRAEVLRGLPAKTKSRTLVCGLTVAYRKHEGGYRWDQSKTPAENKAALLAWALKHEGEMESPNLTEPGPIQVRLDAVKARLDALYDPEQPRFTPPGLEYVPPGESLTVTTKGEK